MCKNNRVCEPDARLYNGNRTNNDGRDVNMMVDVLMVVVEDTEVAEVRDEVKVMIYAGDMEIASFDGVSVLECEWMVDGQ